MIPLVLRSAQGYSSAEAPFHNGAASHVYGFDSANSAARNTQARYRCENKYQQDRRSESSINFVREPTEIADIITYQKMKSIWERLPCRPKQVLTGSCLSVQRVSTKLTPLPCAFKSWPVLEISSDGCK